MFPHVFHFPACFSCLTKFSPQKFRSFSHPGGCTRCVSRHFYFNALTTSYEMTSSCWKCLLIMRSTWDGVGGLGGARMLPFMLTFTQFDATLEAFSLDFSSQGFCAYNYISNTPGVLFMWKLYSDSFKVFEDVFSSSHEIIQLTTQGDMCNIHRTYT